MSFSNESEGEKGTRFFMHYVVLSLLPVNTDVLFPLFAIPEG
jgi:hypothetical protein